MTTNSDDARFMRDCLALAARGAGRVSPNPLVGCVIVRGGMVIGRGWHRRYGAAHAEVDALRTVRAAPVGATLYVNLEPCNHTGNTPPCTEAIIAAGIARVVIGAHDPNPHVVGGGVRRLRAAGLEVRTGVLQDECKELNRFFITHVRSSRPFVTVKLAQSLDGKISARIGARTQLSGKESLRYVHQLRATYDAVLIGAETMRVDGPQLTVRAVRGRNPLRVVLDTHLRATYAKAFLRAAGETIIYASSAAIRGTKARSLGNAGAEVVAAPVRGRGVDTKFVMNDLGRRNIASLLVEGGAAVATSFLAGGLADELQLIVAPRLLGAGVPALYDFKSPARSITSFRAMPLGADVLLVARFFQP